MKTYSCFECRINLFKVLFVIFFFNLFNATTLFSQNVAITDDDSYTAVPSAMLDIYSLNKGMLVPRLDSAQRVSIASPALGLLVFDKTKNSFMYFNGSDWITISSMTTLAQGGEALFAVINANGDTVFAVYNDGVKVTVDLESKGTVGGFAVSGRTPTKAGETIDYFKVTPDSTRIWVNDSIGAKGKVGGFAVSGRTPTKGDIKDYFTINKDSTRIYINDSLIAKGKVGGFAVSGRTPTKGTTNDLFFINSDSTRIYINDTTTSKGKVGGFAISGRTPTKGNDDYFNVSGNTIPVSIYPSEPRIAWYPNKEAFMAGRVIVQYPDSVGLNSSTLGFESKAYGDYSQAFGYVTMARGDYSTAIGRKALANNNNSFAFGDSAQAKNINAYAFGRGALAKGYGSYALGSAGVDSSGTATDFTIAEGDYSFAIGQGSKSIGKGSFSFGLGNIATGEFTIAIGYKAKADGWADIAFGYDTHASGGASTAFGSYNHASGPYCTVFGVSNIASGGATTVMGTYNKASGSASVVMGTENRASGYYSLAAGKYIVANTINMAAFGQYNDTTKYASNSDRFWYSTDPIFVVGNGTTADKRKNALTVLKNGNIGIGTAAPSQKLEIYSATGSSIYMNSAVSNMILFNTTGVAAPTFTTRSAGTKVVFYPGVTSTSADYAMGIEDYTLWFSVPRSTDRLKFYAGTTEIMRIQGNGMIGFGTASPTQKLHIKSSAATDCQVFLEPGEWNSSGDYAQVVFGDGNHYIRGEYAKGITISDIDGVNMPTVYDDGLSTLSPKALYINSAGKLGYNASSKKYKENVYNLDNTDWLYNLRPVTYNYKTEDPSDIQYGLIAEEVDLINPLLVIYGSDHKPDGLMYERLTVPMLKAIQDQQKTIQSQQSEIEQLKERLEHLEKLMIKSNK